VIGLFWLKLTQTHDFNFYFIFSINAIAHPFSLSLSLFIYLLIYLLIYFHVMAAISNNTFELGTHPTKDTIKLITSLLEKITQNNDRLNTNKQATSSVYTCFHARSKPSISIHAYFTRIVKYCPCANECLIALLVYFDRMTRPQLKIAPLQIDSYNIHRLIITGLMISSKLYSDVFFTNTRYAKVSLEN
jgi:uncharacterized protein YhhL (DUF1145 family)